MARYSEKEIRQKLQQMDPYEFEKLVAEIWELEGYDTTVRQASGDRGIDVEAKKTTPFDQKVLIQAKRYADRNKVGSEDIRNYATLYQQVPDADSVVIVTTSSFTSEATELGNSLNIKCIDGSDLFDIVDTYPHLGNSIFENENIEDTSRWDSNLGNVSTSDEIIRKLNVEDGEIATVLDIESETVGNKLDIINSAIKKLTPNLAGEMFSITWRLDSGIDPQLFCNIVGTDDGCVRFEMSNLGEPVQLSESDFELFTQIYSLDITTEMKSSGQYSIVCDFGSGNFETITALRLLLYVIERIYESFVEDIFTISYTKQMF